ncbi:lipopolysaccharide biosynthesis protein [Vibrio sp. F13]|uniref:lipopolysaccharide biosynthesis protein n=1 Tax=Vibrio sp. F13 TaxID=2070777 RepID=UPI0010BD14F0|nr:lipopolysaccharide biosynthesis protein [Vibrio sp. F13]TKF69498.1 lipopolysaccharide biosynthesis protein [Vibrio sp. F13]
MSNFFGKRVLLIAPKFFGYEVDISDTLVSLGADVDFFNERPFSSSLGKIAVRLGVKFFVEKEIKNYYDNILDSISLKSYDYFILISPESIDSDFVEKIKALNPNLYSVLYMWDSFLNRGSSHLVPFFDRVCSFDPQDCKEIHSVEFLPLFFSDHFVSKSERNEVGHYDILFIGTVHSDRVKLVKNIDRYFSSKGYSSYKFFYCPSRTLFFLKKIFTSEFDHISYKEVSFKSLSKLEMQELVTCSNVIIDIHHPSQTGLTMRTLETIGMRKKLITTNNAIKSYDFYNNDNFLVIDRNSPDLTSSFLSSEYVYSNDDIVKKYHIENWVFRLFNFSMTG